MSDRSGDITNESGEEQRYTLADLLRIMERLRDPENGCPWDQRQDFASIVPSTLEECYELAAAIEAEDWPHVEDELGDVLFQVVFYAQLGREQTIFDFDTVVHGLAAKLLRRHPHVFAGGEIEGITSAAIDPAEVKAQWEQIKAQERGEKAQHGALDDIPLALPALQRAQKLQKRAARVGFDWSDLADVFAKVDEELGELREAIVTQAGDAIEEEFGDLLFTVTNLGRHLQLEAERALRLANGKFETRFAEMERLAADRLRVLQDCSADDLEALWVLAKERERRA